MGEPSNAPSQRVVPPSPVMAWAESSQGQIARGVVAEFYEGGAALSLEGELSVGDVVSVRIAFGRGVPTLPAEGRIIAVDEEGDQPQYALRWTCEGAERSALEAQIARLATRH